MLAGEAAPAERNLPVGHVDGLYFLQRGLLHTVQKGTRDVQCVAFLPLNW